MQTILDCGSFESAMVTSALVLGVDRRELESMLLAFDYEKASEEPAEYLPLNELLTQTLFGKGRREMPAADIVYWYHGTRVPKGTDFSAGLLSLRDAKEMIWRDLRQLARELATDDEWAAFRREMPGHHGSQYRGRSIVGRGGGGPYGVLVPETLFEPRELSYHDYLGIPETIEDICGSFDHFRGGNALTQRFLSTTASCLVKFRSRQPRPDAVTVALVYIRGRLRGEGPCHEGNTCYMGQGVSVRASDILSVEWPEYRSEFYSPQIATDCNGGADRAPERGGTGRQA